jgi:mono/diheme cytochrome c family protein
MQGAHIRFETGEMPEILSYLWSVRFLDDRGNPRRGANVFVEKRCSVCHSEGGGAPDLRSRGEYTSLKMIAALWKHGPAMLDRIREKGLLWPRLSANDMTDLIAFLNSGR